MTRTKEKIQKKAPAPKETDADMGEEKVLKPIEIDPIDADDDIPIAPIESEEEDGEETLELDDDEINPFGDKWEL